VKIPPRQQLFYNGIMNSRTINTPPPSTKHSAGLFQDVKDVYRVIKRYMIEIIPSVAAGVMTTGGIESCEHHICSQVGRYTSVSGIRRTRDQTKREEDSFLEIPRRGHPVIPYIGENYPITWGIAMNISLGSDPGNLERLDGSQCEFHSMEQAAALVSTERESMVTRQLIYLIYAHNRHNSTTK
jgi:hypothetical protein